MKVTLIALGNKMPSWVTQATDEYKKRLQDSMQFNLIEIPLLRRSKTTDLARILSKETALLEQAIPPQAYLIALDSRGESFTSEALAEKWALLMHSTSHICFLIGGPEGLSKEIVAKSQERWSLSKLTLPHPLARITLLEALYRAWSIIHNHPYHK